MKEITIRDLYLLFADGEQKLQIKEGGVGDDGLFVCNDLIKETTFGEIASRQFDYNSIEAKIWNRSVRWLDNFGGKIVIMLNKEDAR